MSLQLAIPRRVALQQSSPPLHQPSVILKETRKFEKGKSLNCMCANSKLSQQRGSPHLTVPSFVPTTKLDEVRASTMGPSRSRSVLPAYRTSSINVELRVSY